MKPRLLILIALAGGLALFIATRTPTPAEEEVESGPSRTGDDRGLTEVQQRELITELDQMPLSGDEPLDPPDLTATVEVGTSSGKNRLYFTISEAHGYYVERFRLRAWYKETPEMDYPDSPLTVEHFIDRYLRANTTLRDCIELVPAELKKIGGDIGTSDRWAVEVISHGRAREHDPEVLRYRPDDGPCD